jgi:hypothetical protein
MNTSDGATKLTESLYRAYGTDSGVLFGILPHMRPTVHSIIRLTLKYVGLEIINGEVNFR